MNEVISKESQSETQQQVGTNNLTCTIFISSTATLEIP